MRAWAFLSLFAAAACAQEADSGFELRTTVSAVSSYSDELTEHPRDGAPATAGFRAMLYPTWKLNAHWTVSGAMQVVSRPYAEEDFKTQGYGVKGNLLQLNLSYARFWNHNRSLAVRVGQLSPAFGAFLQRYDSAVNPLIGVPRAYGYYYKPVTFLGLAGAQVDATVGKLDVRAQFVNSSPANPRNIFASDQYGNWAGGLGYTIRQGLRIGGSAYRGPYLDRHYAFFFPGEANPRDLPGAGFGLDVAWGWGHWNAWGELQHFQMDYRAIPTFTQHMGYVEVRRVLNPRWYAASRIGYLRANAFPGSQTYEFGAGFRPGTHQLIKLGYTVQQGAAYPGTRGNIAAIEFVTSFRAISLARD
ncbi:MAG: hypothetical protein ABI833_03380 [Acidobacteriota bacterium]